MYLPIAVNYPHRVLGQGIHEGFEWVVTHNNCGERCGYVRVPPGHPWHGRGHEDVRLADGERPAVHGGLTYAEAAEGYDEGGADAGWWFGFDCNHRGDGIDPDLPDDDRDRQMTLAFALCLSDVASPWGHAWTQAEVEAECRKLCEQAASVLIERED